VGIKSPEEEEEEEEIKTESRKGGSFYCYCGKILFKK
jgi:hypothetical protein